MLNYIWIGLIAIGIIVAVGSDVRDEIVNPYRNGERMEAVIEIGKTPGPLRATYEGVLGIPAERLNAHYGKEVAGGPAREPVSIALANGVPTLLNMEPGEGSLALWREMARSAASAGRLSAKVHAFALSPDGATAAVSIEFEPIHLVRVRAVTRAAFDYAATAVTIALGLIGIMALWLGVMKVAEEAGLLKVLTRLLTPVTKRLFPDVPPDHPAVGSMIMNIAANMLGLSNAATPLGLKAMEELNKLNPRAGTATNAMVTFLAINTGGLILIPATAMAVRAAAGSANPGIIIGTSIIGASAATIAGVAASKLLQRLPRYRKA
ncbi:MAG: nucleoside recognition protein, partial [Bacteroidetes bacterium]|nr:nucleoside recognition protein [Bacteroidota bacterium]